MIFSPYRYLFAHFSKKYFYYFSVLSYPYNKFNIMFTKFFSNFNKNQLKNRSSTLFKLNSNEEEKPNFLNISQTFTSSRRYDRLHRGRNTLELPKILDPVECENVIRYVNATDSNELNNYNKTKFFFFSLMIENTKIKLIKSNNILE